MKPILNFFMFLSFAALAQTTAEAPFEFDKPFYTAVDKWVVFPDNNKANNFPVGFIYIDQQAGFTFDLETTINIDNDKLINPKAEKEKEHSAKFRLQGNTMDVHVLNDKQIKELGLPPVPEWLFHYKSDENKNSYKIDIASFYNSVGGSEIALGILQDIFKQNSKDEKLLFELSYAYNALNRHKEALEVLEVALKRNNKNELYYKEKLFALVQLQNMVESEKVYKDYLLRAKTFNYKAEIAYNIASAYFQMESKKKFEEWKKEVYGIENKNQIFVTNLQMMSDILNPK